MIGVDDLVWFGSQYVVSAEDLQDQRLALDTADLSTLPPTLVITNECDPLRDEAEALAHAIGEAGAESRLERFPGLAHGAFWMSLAVPWCADQRALVAEFLQACAGAEQAERSIAHAV